MSRIASKSASHLIAALAMMMVLGATHAVSAQIPDVRDIKPMVMLLVDSSGSMEGMGTCDCTTPPCEECYPMCGGFATDLNRWANVMEALTGNFDTATLGCSKIDRSTYTGQYDYNYFIPHFEYTFGSQLDNGILDAYVDIARFGLMTFDQYPSLANEDTFVDATLWDAAFMSRSAGARGMYSYGGPKKYNFPGCLTDYAMDNGARGARPPGGIGLGQIVGNMVSVGGEATDYVAINQRVQDSILNMRPYGPTPTAGMLDDVRYYWNNHEDARPIPGLGLAGDPYYDCRARVVMLITDGKGNQDMRGEPYNCDTPGFDCPYDPHTDIASDMCAYDVGTGQCEGLVDGVFVVGFNVLDDPTVNWLDDLAIAGGTRTAYLARDSNELRGVISDVLDRYVAGSTRTTPAFTSANPSGGIAQYQFNVGFTVGTGTEPWEGRIERKRFICDGLDVVEEDIEDDDKFHEVMTLAGASNRTLLTVLPTDPDDTDKHLIGPDPGLVSFSAGGGGGGAPPRRRCRWRLERLQARRRRRGRRRRPSRRSPSRRLQWCVRKGPCDHRAQLAQRHS